MSQRIDRRKFLVGTATAVGAAWLFGRAVDPGGSRDAPDHRVWGRIESWMEAHAPEAKEVLRPGVTDDSIRQAEDILGHKLPEPFRRSVARHDGQELRWPSLIDNGFLMPLQSIVDDSHQLEKAFGPRRGTGATAEWWRPGLVPFVARDGDYLCLDLEPPNGRRRGAVWALLHDSEPAVSRVTPDFSTWLERWAHELEAGVFYLDRAPGTGLLPRDEGRSRLWPS